MLRILTGTVVVYANTSAAVVKARADWVVTSSIAVELIERIWIVWGKIIWAPDRHTGSTCKTDRGRCTVLAGACIVHDEFKTRALTRLKKSLSMPLFWFTLNRRSPLSRWPRYGEPPVSLLRRQKRCRTDGLLWRPRRGIFYKMQQAVPERAS